jgi:hypothetical protein
MLGNEKAGIHSSHTDITKPGSFIYNYFPATLLTVQYPFFDFPVRVFLPFLFSGFLAGTKAVA